ncbi:MAG TPA: inosine/xanthosine triphosphatase [Bacilli bacterium]|nr:inosine/xanthosine triphosphatase [Bacilli bacterium]
MKAIIATKNPGKIEGARKAFSHYYSDLEVVGIPINSDVSDEPVNEEIMLGAKNRVKNLKRYCKKNKISADLFIAIESGITNALGEWIIISVAVIEDNNNLRSWGTSNGFPVPSKYVDEVINTSLGKVMDKIFNETDLADGKGGISLLAKDVVSRIDLTEKAFIMALTQFLNINKWSD